MRSYERNGVVVDQCSGCGGLFLDRGELEHLSQAESAFYEASPTAASAPPASTKPQRYEDHRQPKSKKKKAKSFLEEFFE
jgi:Zn-finger nucleic acid-binding protein